MDIEERLEVFRRLDAAERQLKHQAHILEHQAGIIRVLGQVLTHFVERDHTIMATIDTLTNSVNAFMSADAAVRASDQATIAADNQQIADLQAHAVPDDLIAKLDAATAALNASLPNAQANGNGTNNADGAVTEGTGTGDASGTGDGTSNQS